jgi:hypothetical protein
MEIEASGLGQPRKHHQVDVATGGLAPFAKFRCQGPVLVVERLRLQILQALMHQIERVVDELGSLFGSHGIAAMEKSLSFDVL